MPVVALCVAALAACGSSSSSSTTTSTTAATSTTSSTPAAGANAAVVKLVPSAIKSKGTITVAADASYAPNEFIGSDGHTVVGMDADLSNALAAVMGLKANIVNATFDTIIPGLSGGKYDMGASSFTDTLAREKVVNFVDYFSAGTSFFTKSSGGTSVTGLADLCGKSVSVESGTTEESDAQGQSKKCTAAGKPKVTVLVFPTQTAANLALSSGRAADLDGRLAGRRVSGEAVPRDVQARRPDVRHRAIWPRAPEGKRAGARGAGGAQGAGEERHVHVDPHEVGHPERRAARLRDEDQRRH